MTLSCMCKRNRRRMNSSNSCCNRNPSTRIDGRFTSFFLASTVILCYSLSLTMTMTMTRVDAFIPIPTIPRTTTAITKDLMQSRHWDATVTAVSTSLSLSLSSSLNDDDHEYFFTAPDLTAEETIDHTKTKAKTTTHTTDTKIDLATIASREQNELESMIVNDKEHIQQQEPQREEEEGGQTVTTVMATTTTSMTNSDTAPITTATKVAATTTTTAPSSVSNSIPNSMSISMDVDGNGTGGLMKRSHTGGGTGTDATLMVTSMKTLAFPIDSGKDGMEANDTKRRTRTTETTTQTTNTASDGTGTGTGMRLVRYTSNNSNSNSNVPSSKSKSLVASAATMSKTTTTTKKLVLAPAGTTTRRGTTGTGTHHGTTGGGGGGSAIITKAKDKNTVTNGIVTNSNSRLVRYNGPDLDDTTDYDGMETVSTRNQRQQEIQLSDSKLVMYNPTTPPPDNNYDKSNNNIDPTNNNNKKKKNDEKQQKQKQKHHRPTLTQDIKYSIQYIEKTDFTMARKTGLAVNKPISLWIERDTFL